MFNAISHTSLGIKISYHSKNTVKQVISCKNMKKKERDCPANRLYKQLMQIPHKLAVIHINTLIKKCTWYKKGHEYNYLALTFCIATSHVSDCFLCSSGDCTTVSLTSCISSCRLYLRMRPRTPVLSAHKKDNSLPQFSTIKNCNLFQTKWEHSWKLLITHLQLLINKLYWCLVKMPSQLLSL